MSNFNKEYGKHKYPKFGICVCENGCNCWKNGDFSGGPVGLDYSDIGTCPNNPKDGVRKGGLGDYYYVVNQRIEKLISIINNAESNLTALNNKLDEKDKLIKHIRSLIRDYGE